MSVFFCKETGVRIVAPGVSKSVDAIAGHDECCDEPQKAACRECAMKDLDLEELSSCVVEMKASLQDVDALLASKDSEIASLKRQLSELSSPSIDAQTSPQSKAEEATKLAKKGEKGK